MITLVTYTDKRTGRQSTLRYHEESNQHFIYDSQTLYSTARTAKAMIESIIQDILEDYTPSIRSRQERVEFVLPAIQALLNFHDGTNKEQTKEADEFNPTETAVESNYFNLAKQLLYKTKDLKDELNTIKKGVAK